MVSKRRSHPPWARSRGEPVPSKAEVGEDALDLVGESLEHSEWIGDPKGVPVASDPAVHAARSRPSFSYALLTN
jgi:hypothetical protein